MPTSAQIARKLRQAQQLLVAYVSGVLCCGTVLLTFFKRASSSDDSNSLRTAEMKIEKWCKEVALYSGFVTKGTQQSTFKYQISIKQMRAFGIKASRRLAMERNLDALIAVLEVRKYYPSWATSRPDTLRGEVLAAVVVALTERKIFQHVLSTNTVRVTSPVFRAIQKTEHAHRNVREGIKHVRSHMCEENQVLESALTTIETALKTATPMRIDEADAQWVGALHPTVSPGEAWTTFQGAVRTLLSLVDDDHPAFRDLKKMFPLLTPVCDAADGRPQLPRDAKCGLVSPDVVLAGLMKLLRKSPAPSKRTHEDVSSSAECSPVQN